jgi:hypothetical protein
VGNTFGAAPSFGSMDDQVPGYINLDMSAVVAARHWRAFVTNA